MDNKLDNIVNKVLSNIGTSQKDVLPNIPNIKKTKMNNQIPPFKNKINNKNDITKKWNAFEKSYLNNLKKEVGK